MAQHQLWHEFLGSKKKCPDGLPSFFWSYPKCLQLGLEYFTYNNWLKNLWQMLVHIHGGYGKPIAAIVVVILACTSTSSTLQVLALASSTLLHCYQAKLQWNINTLFWKIVLKSHFVTGNIWAFLAFFVGRKKEQLHGVYPLNSDSLAITHGNVAAGTNYLGMSSEVIVQRSRCSKLYRTYYLKYSEIHHVHQGSQDLCFRWLPVVQMDGWKKILSFWDGATLAGAMLNIGGVPLSISFHKKGGTELSWSVSSVQPLSMWPTNVFMPLKWNTTPPPIWHQKRWLSFIRKTSRRRERSIYIHLLYI